VRNTIARSSLIVALGAALLLAPNASEAVSAAPVFLFAAPQSKTATAATKRSSPKKAAKSSKKRKARPRAQTAPTPERIREIQFALAQKGFYDGVTTGKWDARTAQAMKGFQAANGLTASGKVDAKSLQRLGLGSEIAGAAPPRPSANATKPQQPKQNPHQ
jgi:peptidoglycan hydrolase-like protein with peptidoglycan-binding domain